MERRCKKTLGAVRAIPSQFGANSCVLNPLSRSRGCTLAALCSHGAPAQSIKELVREHCRHFHCSFYTSVNNSCLLLVRGNDTDIL